jgi:hypothetical protein
VQQQISEKMKKEGIGAEDGHHQWRS